MIRIDFAFGARDKWQTACEVLFKHVAAGRRLLVVADDPAIVSKVDARLWSFSDTSFVTHAPVNHPLAQHASVLLLDTSAHPPPENIEVPDGWMMNLGRQCPPLPGGVQRLLEIVSHHEGDRALARQRWQQYKTAGHELRAHEIGARQGNSGRHQ